jgi:hypothetical protein
MFDPFRVGIIVAADPWAVPKAIDFHAFSDWGIAD